MPNALVEALNGRVEANANLVALVTSRLDAIIERFEENLTPGAAIRECKRNSEWRARS